MVFFTQKINILQNTVIYSVVEKACFITNFFHYQNENEIRSSESEAVLTDKHLQASLTLQPSRSVQHVWSWQPWPQDTLLSNPGMWSICPKQPLRAPRGKPTRAATSHNSSQPLLYLIDGWSPVVILTDLPFSRHFSSKPIYCTRTAALQLRSETLIQRNWDTSNCGFWVTSTWDWTRNLWKIIIHTTLKHVLRNESPVIIHTPKRHSKHVWFFLLWKTNEDTLLNVQAALYSQ